MVETSPPSKLDIARWSYAEVLDATKHQDDKIGRFLAAIAFLTSGALVFAANATVLGARFRLGRHILQLPAIALGLFLALVTLSAMLFILATSTPLTLPQAGTRSGHGLSHLFFMSIANETNKTWTDSWANSNLSQDMEGEFIGESLNIARRADRKYQRSTQAAVLFMVALVFFVVGLVLSIEALAALRPSVLTSLSAAQTATTSSSELVWSLRLRLETAALLGLFALILVYDRLRTMRDSDGSRTTPGTISPGKAASGASTSVWSPNKLFWLRVALIVYPASVFLVVLPDGGAQKAFLGPLTLSTALLAAVSLSSAQGWNPDPGDDGRGRGMPAITLAAALILGITGFAAIETRSLDWQLLVGALGAVLPLSSNFQRRPGPHARIDPGQSSALMRPPGQT